jgi:hypothetical protein
MAREASVNSDARSAMAIVEGRVARTQVKYHRWAKTDRTAQFGDLFNLVCHPVYFWWPGSMWHLVRGLEVSCPASSLHVVSSVLPAHSTSCVAQFL